MGFIDLGGMMEMGFSQWYVLERDSLALTSQLFHFEEFGAQVGTVLLAWNRPWWDCLYYRHLQTLQIGAPLSPPASSSVFSCTLLASAFSVSGIHPYPGFFFFPFLLFLGFLFVFRIHVFVQYFEFSDKNLSEIDKKRWVPSNVNYIFLCIG